MWLYCSLLHQRTTMKTTHPVPDPHHEDNNLDNYHRIEKGDPLLKVWRKKYDRKIKKILKALDIRWNAVEIVRWGPEKEPFGNPVCLFILTKHGHGYADLVDVLSIEFVKLLMISDGENHSLWHRYDYPNPVDVAYATRVKVEEGTIRHCPRPYYLPYGLREHYLVRPARRARWWFASL